MVISRVVYKQYLLVGQVKSGNKREGYVVVDTSYNKAYIMSAKDVLAYAKANMIRFCVCHSDELVCRITEDERALAEQHLNQAINSQMDVSSFEGNYLRLLTAFSMSHVQFMKQKGGVCLSMDVLFGTTGLVMYKAIVPHQYAYFIEKLVQGADSNFVEMYDMPNDSAQLYMFLLPIKSMRLLTDIMIGEPIFCNFAGINRAVKDGHDKELMHAMHYVVEANDKNEKKAGIKQLNGTSRPVNSGVVNTRRSVTGMRHVTGRV